MPDPESERFSKWQIRAFGAGEILLGAFVTWLSLFTSAEAPGYHGICASLLKATRDADATPQVMRTPLLKLILVAVTLIAIAGVLIAVAQTFGGKLAATVVALAFWAIYTGTYLWLRRRHSV